MVPAAATRAHVVAELPGAQALGSRHGLTLDWDPDTLVLRVNGLAQPEPIPDDDGRFILVGKFAGYRALPPFWEFEDPDTGVERTLAAYPQPSGGPVSSIFIVSGSGPVVCAPFSRGAFAEAAGPHASDWGSAAGWLSVPGNVIRATTVGEMLNAFVLHFRWTKGRIGPRIAR